MLVKTNNSDADKQAKTLRRDNRVQLAIDCYRGFLKALQTVNILTHPLEHSMLCQRSDSDRDAAIVRIAEVYQEVTGRSPRTTDVSTGKHPFSALIIDLFKQEGLDPPSVYAVRKAIKKTNELKG